MKKNSLTIRESAAFIFDFQNKENVTKKQMQGFCTRFNNKFSQLFEAHYEYHEDQPDTWSRGWRSSDYQKNENDIIIFSERGLMQKSKGSFKFQRAATYTAEYAHFIFITENVPFFNQVLANELRDLRGFEKKVYSNYGTARKEKRHIEFIAKMKKNLSFQAPKSHNSFPNFKKAVDKMLSEKYPQTFELIMKERKTNPQFRTTMYNLSISVTEAVEKINNAMNKNK